MKNDEAIKVFETYLTTGHVPYPYELREASRMAISALKEEMPMPEDTVLFNKGVAEGRRLERDDMLKDAMEGEVTTDNRGNNVVRVGVFNKDFKYGDKVRIVVLKAKEE